MGAGKYNHITFYILARDRDKTFDKLLDFSRREHWYDSEISW
jgi:hypothetical protein